MSARSQRDGDTFISPEQASTTIWPQAIGSSDLASVVLKNDDLFLLVDRLGNISSRPGSDHLGLGLYCQDTRFLSRLELQIEGHALVWLSSEIEPAILRVKATHLQSGRIPAQTLAISRELVLCGGLFEELVVTNSGDAAVSLTLSLSFAADFRDVFEVRGAVRSQRGSFLWVEGSATAATLAYKGMDGSIMESRVQLSLPLRWQGHTALWPIDLAPQASQSIGYRVELARDERCVSQVLLPATLAEAKAIQADERQRWQQQITRIRSTDAALNRVLEQAEADIYLLRQSFVSGKALAAGIPWYCTLFGRDSLIAASQTLLLDPTLAGDTLRILAAHQSRVSDDWRDEDPGKILHELRLGEMARCHEIPHTPYYGSIDATPLWLMLLAEYYAWTADRATLEELWPTALAAMGWLDRHCQPYLSYWCRSPAGLVNQGWKDSSNGIVDRHGAVATGPIALCEVQAYVYAARTRLSRLARILDRPELAQRWQQQADDLRQQFNRDFWVADLGFCALALDGQGRRVDAIASNPGHCLEILDPERAEQVARRLLAPDLFSGWGIRTLSADSPIYDPKGYHTGSVWPHDNGLIAQGMRALGQVDLALQVAEGILAVAERQQRPPELFCGFARDPTSDPLPIPVACSPQAWATAALFQLVRVMVNPLPDAQQGLVRIHKPTLPAPIRQLSIQNLRVGSGLFNLELARVGSETTCRVQSQDLEVVIEG